MYSKLDRSHRALSVVLGVVTLASVGVLLAWDGFPAIFPPRTHDYLAAFALAMIALAYLVFLAAHRPAWREMAKGVALAIAFLFWAANQFWPNLPQATLFNDIAIALFVLDVFLVIVGWPPARQDGVVEFGGMIDSDPEPLAASMRGTEEEIAALKSHVPRFVDKGGIELKGKFVMVSMLLGIAIGLAGSKYIKPRAES